ncbi:CDP-glycerol glycerophosphotransferase family protein [Candidatus Marinimicrobia bacterium]|nr:CDP-glycerol glycerophosphotransferase family protein [Candidatus Neomarinimicrobiota bacterium]
MKKILFETHHLYYWPNYRPIIEELKKRENYTIHASMPIRTSLIEFEIFKKACSELKVSFIEADDEGARIVKVLKNRYDIIVVGNVGQLNKIVHKTTLTVMVYHGIGLKQSYYNDIDDRINIRSVESLDRFNELKKIGFENIFLTGFTKLDRFKTIKKNEINTIKESLNLDLNKKTILFAPTFYPSSLEALYNEIKFLSKECNIIVKLHGFSWEQKRFIYQSQIYEKLSKQNSSIKLLENNVYDIMPYYMIADLLISDISSTLFEYLPLDKPIIQAQCFTLRLKHKIFSNRFWRKLDLKRLENIDFTYKITKADDLLSRSFYALENPQEMSKKRAKALKNFLFKADGKASYRLINAIEEFEH